MSSPRTTESIIGGLTAERDEHAEAGRLGEVQRINQQIAAHEALAALRAERCAHDGDPQRQADLDMQIAHWLPLIDDDVDPAPARRRTRRTEQEQ